MNICQRLKNQAAYSSERVEMATHYVRRHLNNAIVINKVKNRRVGMSPTRVRTKCRLKLVMFLSWDQRNVYY